MATIRRWLFAAPAAAAGGYLAGSVPFGLLLTRIAGVGDIRRIGSGNIGATNVLRTGRKGLALATLLLDGAKGFLAVTGARALAAGPTAAAGGTGSPADAVASVGVVLGHCAPIWLGFRGGKGVATGLGALLGLDRRVGALACLAWLIGAAGTRRSSVGALAAVATGAAGAAALAPRPAAAASGLIAALVTARHRGNIARLLAGTEPAIGRHAAT